MTSDELAKLIVLNNPTEAEVLRGLLEAQGIRVLLSKEGAATAFGLTVGAFAEVEVFVPNSQLIEAKQILDEFLHPGEAERDQD